MVAAVVVTDGPVTGNLLLFSPVQVDNRIKAPGPPTESENSSSSVLVNIVNVGEAHLSTAIRS